MAGWAIVLAVGAPGAGGCKDPAEAPGPDANPEHVGVMSYNLAGEQAGPVGRTLANHIAAVAPDFVAAQECAACADWAPAELGGAYGVAADERGAVAILYDAAAWEVVEEGAVTLGVDDDGWGERAAGWARFSRRLHDAELYVYSTHFCVTGRSPDDDCDVDRHLDYADTVLEHLDDRASPDVQVILAGDFNVFEGFEDGEVVQHFLEAGLVDVYRVAEPDADGITFRGDDGAPSGRIDYIFATPVVDVIDAYVDYDTVPDGDGSDHYAVIATLGLGDAR